MKTETIPTENKATPKPKKKAGRPLLTTDNLPKGWQEKVLNMAAQGCSDIEIRAALCYDKKFKVFHNETWTALEKRSEEFSEVLKRAKVLCEAWWMEQSRKNIKHGKSTVFETASWFINMRNRFGWQDRITADINLKFSAEDILKTISDANKIAKNRIIDV